MSNAIVEYEGGNSALSLWREPEEVLAEAKKAAEALMSVVSQKKNKVMFNNEQYLEREDWGTVAKFYGCTAKVTETKYVEFGDIRGWEAVAICLDKNLNEIGRAESMCLSEEDNWGDVPVYEWQDVLDDQGKKIWDATLRNGKGGYKAKRVEVGRKPKPLFQLRSMAQTRAEAKVLKGIFGWVVVLAGFRPSVAEEMTGNEFSQDEGDGGNGQRPPVTQPARKSQQQTTQAQTEQKIEELQVDGKITGPKIGNNGALWFHLGDSLVCVPEDKLDSDMVEDRYIKVRCIKKHLEKIGDFFVVGGIISLETADGKTETTAKADTEAVKDQAATETAPSGEVSDEVKSINDMFASGEVKKASDLPPVNPTTPGTIGSKKAQRIHILIRENEKKTGFTEAVLKAFKANMELETLNDLPEDLYEELKRWVRGEVDWRPRIDL